MQSFAKLKPSRKFRNLQYISKHAMILGKVMVVGVLGGEITITIVWIGDLWRALQDYFIFYNMGTYKRKSSRFPTRSYLNQPAQLQRLARKLKFGW